MINHIEDVEVIKDVAETQTPDNLEPPPTPAPQPAKQPRNIHLKKENPKNQIFSARGTEQQAETINTALAARKKQLGLTENGNYSIVSLLVDLIKKNNKDFLSSINTK